jgi:hypothetical protein
LHWAEHAASLAAELVRVELRDADHAMLRRRTVWHQLTTYVVASYLDIAAPAPRGAEQLLTTVTPTLRFAL